jgi:hypothetical protein
LFFYLYKRFINARRRIVQPMIDQSNRAGKFDINGSGSDHINEENTPSVSSPTVTKSYKRQNKTRGLSLNERKLHRRSTPAKTPVVSQQLFPSYVPKGKSVKRSNIIF